MSGWTTDELDRIGTADELLIAPTGADGTLRPYTTIWVVRIGDDLYVRSYRGRGGGWFRHALRRPEGRIRAGGVERDVAFEEAGDTDNPSDRAIDRVIDEAYRTKYAGYSSAYVDPMVSPEASAATLRLLPR
jgi:hypothetical protein